MVSRSPRLKLGRRRDPLLGPALAAASAVPGADRYRKHFPTDAHLRILLRHVLSGADSLRQTHADLAGTPDKPGRPGTPDRWAEVGLPPSGISRSQLTRSSTTRPTACAEALFARVLAQARPARPDPSLTILHRVQAIDSTFLRLSAALCPWSRCTGHVPGVTVQAGLDLDDDVATSIPSWLRLTRAADQDVPALKARDLAELAGWTVLIDLGYYAHPLFAQLRAADVSFVCRLHPQASYRVTNEVVAAGSAVSGHPTPDGDVVVSDQRITLGSPNNRRSTVVPDLRLVVSQNLDGTTQRFVSDRWDLTADEIATLYRKRWRIELFFRFLKRQLKMLHPFGQSREAVWLTVLIAATVALLATLTDGERPGDLSRVAWLRVLERAIHQELATPRPAAGGPARAPT